MPRDYFGGKSEERARARAVDGHYGDIRALQKNVKPLTDDDIQRIKPVIEAAAKVATLHSSLVGNRRTARIPLDDTQLKDIVRQQYGLLNRPNLFIFAEVRQAFTQAGMNVAQTAAHKIGKREVMIVNPEELTAACERLGVEKPQWKSEGYTREENNEPDNGAESSIVFRLTMHPLIDKIELNRLKDGALEMTINLLAPPLVGNPGAQAQVVGIRHKSLAEWKRLNELQRLLETGSSAEPEKGSGDDMAEAMSKKEFHVKFDAGPRSKIRSVLEQAGIDDVLKAAIMDDLGKEWARMP